MVRRTRSEWRELFAAHESSGLSAAAFCREKGLNPKYFSLRKRALAPVNNTAAFVPVKVSPPEKAMITLDYSGVIIKVPMTVSASWLSELISSFPST